MNKGTEMDAEFHMSYTVDEKTRHQILRSSMVFPRTPSLKENKPVVCATYTCEGTVCNFQKVFNAVANNQDLQAWGHGRMLQEILKDIEKNPDYSASIFDGFQINRDGKDLLRFTREGADGQGRTGFLEYNNFRHELIEEQRTQRIIAAVNAKNPSCVIL